VGLLPFILGLTVITLARAVAAAPTGPVTGANERASMGALDRLLRAAAIALVAVGACVPLVSELDRPCPCAEGFICCETTHTCRKQSECPQPRTDSDAPYDSTDDLADRDATSSPDISAADVLDGAVGADSPPVQDTTDSANDLAAQDTSDATAPDAAGGNVEDACVPDAQAGPQIIAYAFLDIGMMSQSERFYSGQFQLGRCTHLANGNASALYTQDANSIPPLTSGLTILHTFEPAGPYMTPPATQPAGKYSISQVSLAYDAIIDTYTWSFYGINYVIWPCTPSPTCTSVDDALYRVVIDVRQ